MHTAVLHLHNFLHPFSGLAEQPVRVARWAWSPLGILQKGRPDDFPPILIPFSSEAFQMTFHSKKKPPPHFPLEMQWWVMGK